MSDILKTVNLSKRYGKTSVVDNINISIKEGEVYGFLGQNGAGKTTTIRMIMGLVKPTSGEIELFGNKAKKGQITHYKHVGLVTERSGFYQNLSAFDNLDIHRRLMGITNKECIEKALDTVGMLNAKNKTVKNYSLGMKQRLNIARALLHNPKLLIMDEPTNGLDPIGIKEIRQLIQDLSIKLKVTILMSSHILSEVQQLATKLSIIHKGKLLEEIDFVQLQKKNRGYVEIKVSDVKKTLEILEARFKIYDSIIIDSGVIQIYDIVDDLSLLNRTLVENGIDISGLTSSSGTLESYFVHMIGGEFNV